jgi:pimeloyl-ACP methyl ester carboxylesterase
MPQVTANNINLEYESYGSKSREAVLLIQGMSAQLIHWPLQLCHELVARGYRVIRFDNRDAGLSTKFHEAGVPNLMARFGLHAPAPPYTLRDMALDAIGLLDALDTPRAHIVGASMGGMIAQLIAADHPARTLSLTSIMSTSGAADLPSSRPAALAALMAPYPPADDREALVARLLTVRRAIASPAYPMSNDEMRRLAVQSLDRSYCPDGAARQMAAALAAGDRRSSLARITAPTVVLHGEDDPLVPVECGIDTAKHIPGAELRIVPGMGHDFPPGLVKTMADAICAAAERARRE